MESYFLQNVINETNTKTNNIIENNLRNQIIFDLCCKHNRLDILKKLKCKNKEYGFIIACKNGNYEIVEYLSNLKININLIDINMMTGFMWSINNKHYNIMRLLIKNKLLKIEVNYLFKIYNYELDLPDDEYLYIIKLLYEIHNVNLFLTNNSSQTCFILACFHGKLKIVKYLVNRFYKDKKFNVNHVDGYQNNGLIYAIKNKHFKVASFLIDNCPEIDFNYLDENKNNVLMLACLNNSLMLVNKLCESGLAQFCEAKLINKVNLSWLNKNKENALLCSCISNNIEMVRLLLDKNNIHQININNYNAFTFACINKNFKLMKLLMKYNVIIELKALNNYMYPIMFLCIDKNNIPEKPEVDIVLNVALNINEKTLNMIKYLLPHINKGANDLLLMCNQHNELIKLILDTNKVNFGDHYKYYDFINKSSIISYLFKRKMYNLLNIFLDNNKYYKKLKSNDILIGYQGICRGGDDKMRIILLRKLLKEKICLDYYKMYGNNCENNKCEMCIKNIKYYNNYVDKLNNNSSDIYYMIVMLSDNYYKIC